MLPDGRPDFRLNLEEPVKAIGRDPQWVAKVALGALFNFLTIFLVGNIFTWGYLQVYSERVTRAEPQPLPAWEDWGEIARKGALSWLIVIIYQLPFIGAVILLYGAFFIGLLGTNATSAASPPPVFFLFYCFFPFLIPLQMLLFALIPAALAQLVLHDGDVVAAFRFGEIGRFLGRYRGQYAVMALLVVVGGYMLNQLGSLALCLGYFVTQFLVHLYQAHLIGQFCWCERNVVGRAVAPEGKVLA